MWIGVFLGSVQMMMGALSLIICFGQIEAVDGPVDAFMNFIAMSFISETDVRWSRCVLAS